MSNKFIFLEYDRSSPLLSSLFLHYAILLEAGMDVGIMNALELLAIDKLVEDNMSVLCENLVLNTTEEATEDMLQPTAGWVRVHVFRGQEEGIALSEEAMREASQYTGTG